MLKKSPQSLGGTIRGIAARREALERYDENPARCRYCNILIPLSGNGRLGKQVQEARRRKFCSWNCSKISHRETRGGSIIAPPGEITVKCSTCLQPFSYTKTHRTKHVRKFCAACVHGARIAARGHKAISSFTEKKQLFDSRSSWQSARTAVRQHATQIAQKAGMKKACAVCGYNKHVELAHREAVSAFPDQATLGQINAPSNLFYLCPNHHWEYDAGQLAV